MKRSRRFAGVILPMLISLFTGLEEVAAQSKGLLLGVRTDSGYRTIWIDPSGAPAAQAGGILVPRPDGWWRFDVIRVCGLRTATEYNDSVTLIERTDLLTRQQVGTDVISTYDFNAERALYESEVEGNCGDAEAAVRKAVGREPAEEDECSEDSMELTYVSPSHISFTGYHSTTEFCSPDKYYYDHHRMVMTHDGAEVELLPLLSPSEAQKVTDMWRELARECTTLAEPKDWNVVRASSRWEVRLQIVNTRLCVGNDTLDVSYWGDVPPAIAPTDSLGALEGEITARHPNYADAFVSAERDRIAILENNELFLYEVSAARLGKRISTTGMPGYSSVLMAEWSDSTPPSVFAIAPW